MVCGIVRVQCLLQRLWDGFGRVSLVVSQDMLPIDMSELKEIALRKIGRNVVNFQKIEAMLKVLVSQINFKGPINEITEILEERKEFVQKQSMGNLMKDYFKSFSSSIEHVHKYPDGRNEAWVSFSLQIENEDGGLPQQKAAFNFLVSERNRLIHQMLSDFDAESKDSCNALIMELDQQDEMIQREYTNLQHLLKSLHEAKNELLKDFAK